MVVLGGVVENLQVVVMKSCRPLLYCWLMGRGMMACEREGEKYVVVVAYLFTKTGIKTENVG